MFLIILSVYYLGPTHYLPLSVISVIWLIRDMLELSQVSFQMQSPQYLV